MRLIKVSSRHVSKVKKKFLGYLRDIINDEHYHFVSVAMTRASYLTALFVMLIFVSFISIISFVNVSSFFKFKLITFIN